MASDAGEATDFKQGRRWVEYAVKAVILVAVFALIAWLAPMMPPICLAVIWAVLSIASAVGVAYHYVINKAVNRVRFEDGGVIARFNGGRTITLLLAFVVSAACIGGLILELPKWKLPDWAMLVVTMPLYIGIYRLMEKALKKEYKPLLRVSRTVAYSSGVLCVLLLVVYLVLCLLEPVPYYENLTDALLSTYQPFEKSPSVLLSDLGYLSALVDALSTFAMTRIAEGSLAGYLVWRIVLCASTALGLSGLLGTCALELRELKLVFQPLEAVDHAGDGPSPLKRYIVIACVLPVLLVAGAIGVDAKAAEVAQTDEYTAVRAFVRERAGMVACKIDGKLYDYERVKALFDKNRSLSDALAAEREEVLTPLINEAFDKRVENVDAYLDWYYSIPADYERLVQFFSGTIEAGMMEQLESRISEGVDDTELNEKLDYYRGQSEELMKQVTQELEQYELEKRYGLEEIPEWLIEPVSIDNMDSISAPMETTEHFLDAGERMGLSAGAGVISGVIAKKIASSIAEKAFFKKIVASLIEKLAMRGLATEAGTLIAPGVGTAVGFGVGFAADYFLLKVDEAMNRESYKEEMVNAINEQREKWLDMVRVPNGS